MEISYVHKTLVVLVHVEAMRNNRLIDGIGFVFFTAVHVSDALRSLMIKRSRASALSRLFISASTIGDMLVSFL